MACFNGVLGGFGAERSLFLTVFWQKDENDEEKTPPEHCV